MPALEQAPASVTSPPTKAHTQGVKRKRIDIVDTKTLSTVPNGSTSDISHESRVTADRHFCRNMKDIVEVLRRYARIVDLKSHTWPSMQQLTKV